MVLTALAKGLDPSAAERVFGFRQATITRWLTRAGKGAHPARALLLPSLAPRCARYMGRPFAKFVIFCERTS